MIRECTSLKEIDVSHFDTRKSEYLSTMFYNCHTLTSLDISNFNFSSTTTIMQMFYNCTNLSNLNIQKVKSEKLTSMNEMFAYCKSLTSLDLTGFDTSTVSKMDNMFSNSGLQYLDLSTFDTRKCKITTLNSMFNNCKGLKIKVNRELWPNIDKVLPIYVTIIE